MGINPDYYTVLGVLRESSAEQIKRAYFEAAQRLHPDKNVAVGETELFLEIQKAYEVLSNPKRRTQYDATLPPEFGPHPLLKHQAYFSRPNLVQVAEPQLIYVLLEVAPHSEAEKIPAPPLNICLLLDRSTSMQGEKMDMLKAAAVQFIRSLRPQDKFTIVTFSDRAEVLISAGVPGDGAKHAAQIQMIQPGGATEIYQGLQAGVREIRQSHDPARVNHIILLTDGHTYGDEQACLELAEQLARENIGMTGMGVGNEWNDIFMDALASRTGGTSAYISKPRDIQRLLVEKFKTLASVYADEVVLKANEQAGVELKYLFRIQPESGPVALEGPWLLGPILQDIALKVFFEFVVEPSALKDGKVMLLNGSLKASIAAYARPVPPIRVRFIRDIGPDAGFDPPPQNVLQALARLMLYRMQERAHAEAQAGRYENAAQQLQALATHLLAQGEHQLAKTALLEAELLEQKHAWSLAGRKEIKYHTRALLTP